MRLEWKPRTIGHYYELEEGRETEHKGKDQIEITEEETTNKAKEGKVGKEQIKTNMIIKTKIKITTMRNKATKESSKTKSKSSRIKSKVVKTGETIYKINDKKHNNKR